MAAPIRTRFAGSHNIPGLGIESLCDYLFHEDGLALDTNQSLIPADAAMDWIFCKCICSVGSVAEANALT